MQRLYLVYTDLAKGEAGGAELLAVLPQLSSLSCLGLVNVYDLQHYSAGSLSAITLNNSLQDVNFMIRHVCLLPTWRPRSS